MSTFDQKGQRVGDQTNVAGDQNIYQTIPARMVAEEELKAALLKLAELPEREVPQPAPMPEGSRFPSIRPNPLFVGREDELKELAKYLKGGESVAIGQVAAATGMGGIGKTQLASEFAHRYGQYFAGGVYWLSFASPELVPNEVAACGDPGDERPQEEQVRQVLSEWKNQKPRLLIFDNCEDAKLLTKWLPPTGGSRVLVTSRQSSWDPGMGVRHYPLGLFEKSESLALLRKFRGEKATSDKDLNEIADELGDLPLALHMAGSHLRTYRHEITARQYLEAIRKPGLLEHVSMKKGEFSPTGHDLHVGRTFAVSVGRLNEEDESDLMALEQLVRVACYAPGELIPRGLLKGSMGEEVDDTQFADGVERLLGLGLVEEDEAGDVRMHRLVSSFVRQTRPIEAALQADEQAVSDKAYEANESGYPSRMQPLLAHLKYLTDRALKREDERSAALAINLGYYLRMIADYAGARPYYEQALAIRRKVQGEEHPKTANCLNNLGGVLQDMGDYEGAREYYEQSLEICRKVLGEEHPYTATSLNNLGLLLQDMGDYEGARPYYEQSLAIRRKVQGEEHPDTATSLNNLGLLLQALGDYEGARPYYEQSLAIRRKVLGAEHPDTATSLNNLGLLLQAMGDYEGAREYYELSLAISRKVLGEEHPHTAISLNNLGFLLAAMGDYEGARPYLEQSLAISRKVLGEEHPDTASGLNNLGGVLKAMGDYEGARSYYEQALAIRRKVLGDEHPYTANSLSNLGVVLKDMGDYEGARQYYEQSLVIRRKVLGEEHPNTASSLNNLGALLQAMGDYEGARSYLEQSLAIRRKVLGEEHPDTANSLNNLGGLLNEMGDYEGARSNFEQALRNQ